MAIKHTFVNSIADESDASIVRPSDWNADHSVDDVLITDLNADLLDGQHGAYYLDSANFTGTNWTDLTDAGDTILHKHDIYLLADGTRALTGNWDAGAFGIQADKFYLADNEPFGFGNVYATPDILVDYDSATGAFYIDLTGTANNDFNIKSSSFTNNFFLDGATGHIGIFDSAGAATEFGIWNPNNITVNNMKILRVDVKVKPANTALHTYDAIYGSMTLKNATGYNAGSQANAFSFLFGVEEVDGSAVGSANLDISLVRVQGYIYGGDLTCGNFYGYIHKHTQGNVSGVPTLTATNWYTVYSQAPALSGVGAALTLTNRYGTYMADYVGATITNQYGHYIEELTAGSTLNNEIFLAGGGEIFFRDQAIHVGSLTDGHLDLTADISIDMNGAVVGSDTALFTRLIVDDVGTYIDKDGSNNMIFVDAVTGSKTLAELAAGGGGEGHIAIFPFDYSSVFQGTWSFLSLASQWGAYVFRNSSTAINDALDFQVYLEAGTYSLSVLYVKFSTYGIMEFYNVTDASSIGTIDGYAAGVTYNQLTTLTGYVVSSAGLKTIRMRSTTKNASSSAYQMSVSSFAFFRTA